MSHKDVSSEIKHPDAMPGALAVPETTGELAVLSLDDTLLNAVSTFVDQASYHADMGATDWLDDPSEATELETLKARLEKAKKAVAKKFESEEESTTEEKVYNLLNSGSDAEARKLIDSEKDPQTKVGLLASAAKHFFEQGEDETGKGIINRANRTIGQLKDKSEKIDSQITLAKALVAAGRTDEAVTILKSAIALDTDAIVWHRGPAESLLKSALILTKLGKDEVAADALKLAQRQASLIGTEVNWSGHVEERQNKRDSDLRVRGAVLEEIALAQLRLGNVTEALSAVSDISSEVTPERQKALINVVNAIVGSPDLNIGLKAEVALRWLSPMDPEYVEAMTSLGKQQMALQSGSTAAQLPSKVASKEDETKNPGTALAKISSEAIMALIPSDPKGLEALVSMISDPAERAIKYTEIAISVLASGDLQEGMRLFDQILENEDLHGERAAGGYLLLIVHRDHPEDRRSTLGGFVAKQLAEQGNFEQAAYLANETHLGQIIEREAAIPNIDPLLEVAKAFQRAGNLKGALEMLKDRVEDYRDKTNSARKFWSEKTGQTYLPDDTDLAKRLLSLCGGLASEVQTIEEIDTIYEFMNNVELKGMKQPNLELRPAFNIFISKLLEAGDFEKALQYAKLAPTRENSLPEYRNNSYLYRLVASGYVKLGEFDKAGDFLKGNIGGVSLDREDAVRLTEEIAKAKMATGDIEAARENYQKVWDEKTVYFTSAYERTNILRYMVKAGLVDEAIDAFRGHSSGNRIAQELIPQVAEGLVSVLSDANKIDKAIEIADSITDEDTKKQAFLKITKTLIANGRVNDDMLLTVATEAGITNQLQLANLILDSVESNLRR